jgi:hypothetical protein
MSPFASIFISNISNIWSPELISTTFYEAGIAKIKSIILKNNYMFENDTKCAIIDIYDWIDTTEAYEFINYLKNSEYGLIYDVSPEESWNVYKDTNDYKFLYNFDIRYGDITQFTNEDYKYDEVEDEDDDKLENMSEVSTLLDEIEEDYGELLEEMNS